MPAYENLIYEKQRNGALLTLNRPEAMNALSMDLRSEIADALEEARNDEEVRAVVITGAGARLLRGRGHRRWWRRHGDGVGLALRPPGGDVPARALRRLARPGQGQHR